MWPPALKLVFLFWASCYSLSTGGKNLAAVYDCLKLRRADEDSKNSSVSALEEHYADLLQKTGKYRDVQMHTHAGFSGPWIENIFISRFLQAPLATFHGMVPLFLQWTDIMVLAMHGSNELLGNLTNSLPSLLHSDVVYVAVSQHDYGLGRNLTLRCPNLLVLSAGGYGHVPLPLIKGELPYFEPPLSMSNFTYDFSFFGTNTHIKRARILVELQQALDDEDANYKFALHDRHWMQKMSRTKFNFGPRGLGRSSFRLTEIVQMGRIPISLDFDESPWLPYGVSNLSIFSIGYAAKIGTFKTLIRRLVNASDAEVRDKLERVRGARRSYTYDGVIEQIASFFRDPFGPLGGELQCSHLPGDVN